MRKIIIAARGSKLSLIQANIIKNKLEKSGRNVEILEVSTKGDRDRVSPIINIGGRGLFVTEIEKYLLDCKADIAVHSGKDLPYELQKGLTVAGVPKAADPRDCLISRKGEAMRNRFVIGTGSPRRIAECKRFYPDAEYINIRGNVDTRLEKLRNGEYDAVILAKAGLDRLGADLSDFNVRIFDTDEFIPSACQGIIAAECRESDGEIRELLDSISDTASKKRFDAERYMMGLMRADCSVPLGVHAQLQNDKIFITAMLGDKKASANGEYKYYISLCEKIREELYE